MILIPCRKKAAFCVKQYSIRINSELLFFHHKIHVGKVEGWSSHKDKHVIKAVSQSFKLHLTHYPDKED